MPEFGYNVRMFDIYDLMVFFLLVLILVYWWRISEQKPFALKVAGDHCRKSGFQLLDQSLVFTGYRFTRDKKGNNGLCRAYEFEFCQDSDHRYQGEVMLRGMKVIRIVLQTDHAEVTDFDS